MYDTNFMNLNKIFTFWCIRWIMIMPYLIHFSKVVTGICNFAKVFSDPFGNLYHEKRKIMLMSVKGTI